MKIKKFSEKPSDIDSRVGAKTIVCYPNTNIEEKNLILQMTGYKMIFLNLS